MYVNVQLCVSRYLQSTLLLLLKRTAGANHINNIFGGYILNMESELFANHCVLLNRCVSPLVSEKQ